MVSMHRKISDGIGIISIKGNLIDPDALSLTNEVKKLLTGPESKILEPVTALNETNN